MDNFDCIIRNGIVVDGSGNLPFPADIGIIGSKIAKIGNIPDVDSKITINASGLYVSPGFIDMHSHADFSIITNPYASNLVRQGI
ncbi:MAG: D-aminoacylase, partial [Candidatus Heimdallarchaeota archaeon]|nr:D-aminoacylase [Candidatus Heimdallarchaeota archaeon]